MSPDSAIHREQNEARAVYQLRGAFDRDMAWALRNRIESEEVPDLLIDFSLVRDFSDLAVAVLAHGLAAAGRQASFRGLRQHQVRILRYCGIPIDESGPQADARPSGHPERRGSVFRSP